MKPSLEVFEAALSAGEPSESLLEIVRLNMSDSGVPVDTRGWDWLTRKERLIRVLEGLDIAREARLGTALQNRWSNRMVGPVALRYG